MHVMCVLLSFCLSHSLLRRFFFLMIRRPPRSTLFPYRRSSDLLWGKAELLEEMDPFLGGGEMIREVHLDHSTWNDLPYKDRKSTRLNSSHANISYAVFCLKKKKNHKSSIKQLITHSNKKQSEPL